MAEEPPRQTDRSARIQQLAAQLLSTEAELQALTAGEVDAVLDPRGATPLLLREAQQALRRNEARARELIARLPIIACELEPDGTTRFVNDAVTAILGYEPAALVGRAWWPAISGGETDGGSPPLHEEVVEQERIVRARDGSERVVLWTATHLLDPQQRLRTILLFGLDVTEHRRAEAAARQLIHEQGARAEAEAGERRAALLSEASRLLGSALRYEATLTSIARLAVTDIAEYCIVDVVEGESGVHRIDVAYPDLEPPDPLREMLASQKPGEGLHVISDVIGSGMLRVEEALTAEAARGLAADPLAQDLAGRSIICAPLVARGGILGAITVLSRRGARPYTNAEVTLIEELARRAALAVDNARLYEDALAASRAKSEFLAVMSHELRTPLNAIIGYADLLLLGVPAEVPAPATRHVERVHLAARHLLQMIDEILTLSRVEAGEEVVRREQCEFCEFLRDTAALMEPLARSKRLELHCVTPADEAHVLIDTRKVRQIVLNLLSNAVKFTAAGTITVTGDVEADALVVMVEDSGVGIASENHEHIFDAFWQVDQGRSRGSEGTGLGLHVSRRLAQLMGGSLEVSSQPGQGTCFRLRVPLGVPLRPHTADAERRSVTSVTKRKRG